MRRVGMHKLRYGSVSTLLEILAASREPRGAGGIDILVSTLLEILGGSPERAVKLYKSISFNPS